METAAQQDADIVLHSQLLREFSGHKPGTFPVSQRQCVDFYHCATIWPRSPSPPSLEVFQEA